MPCPIWLFEQSLAWQIKPRRETFGPPRRGFVFLGTARGAFKDCTRTGSIRCRFRPGAVAPPPIRCNKYRCRDLIWRPDLQPKCPHSQDVAFTGNLSRVVRRREGEEDTGRRRETAAEPSYPYPLPAPGFRRKAGLQRVPRHRRSHRTDIPEGSSCARIIGGSTRPSMPGRRPGIYRYVHRYGTGRTLVRL